MRIKSLFVILFILLFLPKLDAQGVRGKLQLIIDADTANEIDDLFAIVRALGEPRFKLLGITAAQFHNSPYATKNTALESQEMNQVLLSFLPKYKIPLKLGSAKPLQKATMPQSSEASRFIISQARILPQDKKLHIVILGSCTNLASALLEAPEIYSKLVVSYIGFWHDSKENRYDKKEFNTGNDPIATNILLNFKGLDFRVMSATTCQNLVFDKDNTFKKLRNSDLGLYLKQRWNTYKRWWTSKDIEQRRWIMWDVAIIEALAHPEWAVKKVFKTPKENRQREIQIYTVIDTVQMQKDFWRHYQTLIQ